MICPQLTEPAMLSLLAVIKKKSQADLDEDEEEDMDDEDDSGVEESGDDEGDEEESESEDEDSEPELEEEFTDKAVVSGEFVQKISDALGDHGAESGEDDMDMDAVPDEDMASLDRKLVEAFRAIGGRKDRLAKKKEAMAALAEMHFKLRVLDLVELYLTNKPSVELVCTIVPALIEALDRAVRSGADAVLVTRLVAVLGRVAGLSGKLGKEEASGARLVQVLTGVLGLATSGSVVVSTLSKVYPRLATSLLRLGEAAGQEEQLVSLYLASLKDFLNTPACVLPNEVFSLALAHSWPGCWALATLLATEALRPSVRQFRRVAALSLLFGLLSNKRLLAEHPDKMAELVQRLVPTLTAELGRIVEGDIVHRVKPKYLQEVFSLLLTLRKFPNTKFGPEFDAQLTRVAGAWPQGKHFTEARKVLVRLGQRCGLQLVVVTRQRQGGGEGEVTPKKEKKVKKKKKSKEQLKKAKEMKMDLAQAQVEVGVPSFAEFVTDSTEVVEESSNKRGLEDGTSSRDKKHKRKKQKKETAG